MAASSRQQCPMSCVRLRLLSQILRCGKGLFFLAAASEQKEAEKQYEFLEHIRRALFKLRGADLADGGHVGHRCPAHLPCHRQKDGAQSAAAHGVRCHSGQSSRIRCHHAGRHRWPYLCRCAKQHEPRLFQQRAKIDHGTDADEQQQRTAPPPFLWQTP